MITKNRISPFYKMDLEDFITKEKVNLLFIGGIMTNLWVRRAMSDAYDRGFEIIRDACVSDFEETDDLTFRDIKITRPKVKIVSSKEAVSSLKTGN